MYTHDDTLEEAINKYYLMSLWDTSNITDMSYLFSWVHDSDSDSDLNFSEYIIKIRLFNEDISLWNVSNVKNMRGIFRGCHDFNQPLERWVDFMFDTCKKFNQPLNSWNVENVKTMWGYVCKLYCF